MFTFFIVSISASARTAYVNNSARNRKASASSSSLSIAWLDLRSAFTCIPHAHIFRCFEAMQIGAPFISLQPSATFMKMPQLRARGRLVSDAGWSGTTRSALSFLMLRWSLYSGVHLMILRSDLKSVTRESQC